MAITIPWSSRRCTARTSSGRPSAMSASNSMIKPSEPALRRLTSASSESNRLPPNRCAMACAAYKARGDGLLAFISAGLSQRFGQRLARVYSKRQQYPPGFGRAMQCRAQLGQELASPQLAATPDRIHRRRRVGLKHRRPGYSRANRCSPHLWLNRQPQHVIGAGSHRIVGSGIASAARTRIGSAARPAYLRTSAAGCIVIHHQQDVDGIVLGAGRRHGSFAGSQCTALSHSSPGHRLH